MPKLNIILDGKKVQAEEGQTILEVAKDNGIEIPTLCHQQELRPFTSCFVCVVEVKGARTLLPSCGTKVTEGMEVMTMSDRIRSTRKMCLELLLSDHLGDCMAPCQAACPAGCDIPGFIYMLLTDRKRDAIALIKDTIPLAASLGRVCPHPCEDVCRRSRVEESISICALKRYVADEDLNATNTYIPEVKPDTGKRVAIVGGGPAGLSAAFYLRREGHKPVVFDANIKAGGMLRYGIPAYRLPREVLDREIWVLNEMGIDIKQEQKLGRDFSMDDLKKDFDAIFVAVGAQIASSMGVKGEEEGGVLSGIEFLEDVSKGREVDIGDDVVVVGGGNTAIDAARTSVRLGAKNVTILYRRTRKEMPASDIEIREAEHEGVKIDFLVAPTAMERTNDGIVLTCIRMELGEPDASGRRKPVPIKGSEFKVKASSVVSAIGQKVDLTGVNDLRLTKWNTLDVNPYTFETSEKAVFAGGDCSTGADIAIRAIAAGRKAATSIDQFLNGKKVTGEPLRYNSTMGDKPAEVPSEVFEAPKMAGEKPRTKMNELKLDERIREFLEVEKGFSYDQALNEAKRCLTCGCSSADSCTLRALGTEYGVDTKRFKGAERRYHIDDSNSIFQLESHKCILCGSCVRVCGEEVKDLHCLGFTKRGFDTEILPPLRLTISETKCDTCLKCVDMCPTGALSLKNPGERWK